MKAAKFASSKTKLASCLGISRTLLYEFWRLRTAQQLAQMDGTAFPFGASSSRLTASTSKAQLSEKVCKSRF